MSVPSANTRASRNVRRTASDLRRQAQRRTGAPEVTCHRASATIGGMSTRASLSAFAGLWRQFWQGYWRSPHGC
jgi:hypothetical protein